MTSAKKSGP